MENAETHATLDIRHRANTKKIKSSTQNSATRVSPENQVFVKGN